MPFESYIYLVSMKKKVGAIFGILIVIATTYMSPVFFASPLTRGKNILDKQVLCFQAQFWFESGQLEIFPNDLPKYSDGDSGKTSLNQLK